MQDNRKKVDVLLDDLAELIDLKHIVDFDLYNEYIESGEKSYFTFLEKKIIESQPKG